MGSTPTKTLSFQEEDGLWRLASLLNLVGMKLAVSSCPTSKKGLLIGRPAPPAAVSPGWTLLAISPGGGHQWRWIPMGYKLLHPPSLLFRLSLLPKASYGVYVFLRPFQEIESLLNTYWLPFDQMAM